MPRGQLTAVLRQLRQLVGVRPEANSPDHQLLLRFARQRDAEAFAAVVDRHGPMVFNVCRRIMRNSHEAEDVFQATFLVLSRKAASIRTREALAGWLYRVACRLAIAAREAAARQRLHEKEVWQMRQANATAEATWQDLQPVLDEELQKLPEKYRLPVVLCHLQGKTHEAAAQELGWPKGTVAGRLARARELLRTRLTRRGVALSAGLLATLLTENAAVALLPASLLPATVQASILFASAGATAGAISPHAIELAEKALKAMLLTQLKIGAMLFLVVALVATGAGMMAFHAAPPRGPDARQDEPADPPAKEAKQPSGEAKQEVRTDLHGDPLPPGAVVRMGTVRLRHGGPSSVVFAGDGKTLLSSGSDHTIRHWDMATGKQVEAVKVQLLEDVTPRHCLLSADGKTLASGRWTTIQVWEASTGKERCRIALGQLSVYRLALSADGKTIAAVTSGSKDDGIKLWDATTGELRHELSSSKGLRDHITFSPDGTMLAAMSWRQAIQLWEVATGKELHKTRAGATCIAFSPDGKTLAFGNQDRTVEIWDVAAGKVQRVLKYERIRSLAFSPDGSILACGGADAIFLWDMSTKKQLHKLPDYLSGQLQFSPDSKILACWRGSTIRLWDVGAGKLLHSRHGHQGLVDSVAISPDGKTLVSSSWEENTVRLWETATGKPLHTFQEHEQHVSCVGFSQDGKLVISGGREGTVRLWDAASGKELHKLVMHDLKPATEAHEVVAFGLSRDGKTLAAISRLDVQYQLYVWDVASGKRITERAWPQHDLDARPRFSPDGQVATLPTAKGLAIQEVATGRTVRMLAGKLTSPFCFSADGKLFAAGVPKQNWARDVSLFDLATGERLLTIETGRVEHAALSPDGRMLATASLDALHLWELATGQEVFRRERREESWGSFFPEYVTSLAFCPDGRTLATGLPDTTILLWDLLPEAAKATKGTELDLKDLDRLWTDVAGEDARKAYEAMWTLTVASEKAVPFLKERLTAAKEDIKRTEQLIRDLDSDKFAVRQAASKELERLGEITHPALRQVLQENPPLELRRRVEGLLELPGIVRSSDVLRRVRAIGMLEHIGSREARQILTELAKGAPAARETRDAKAALERLAAGAR